MSIFYDSVGAFLTAAALLAAVAAVWAQFWLRPLDKNSLRSRMGSKVNGEFITRLGALWSNISILMALFAFAFAGFSYWNNNDINIFPLAIGFLILSFLMIVVNISQSIFASCLVIIMPCITRCLIKITSLCLWKKLFRKSADEDIVLISRNYLKLVWVKLFILAFISLCLVSFVFVNYGVDKYKPFLWSGLGIFFTVAIIGVVLLWDKHWYVHYIRAKLDNTSVVLALIGLILILVRICDIGCLFWVGVGVVVVATLFDIKLLCRLFKSKKEIK